MKKILVLFSFNLCFTFAKDEHLKRAVDAESYSHQERIKILREADECIKNAKTKEDFKRCEQMEREKREELRSKLFEMRKQNVLAGIDQKITKLQQKRDCIAGATSYQQIKECHNKYKAE